MYEGHKEDRIIINREVVQFNYPEFVADNYRYRGAVDNHNALGYDGRTRSKIGLNIAWVMT